MSGSKYTLVASDEGGYDEGIVRRVADGQLFLSPADNPDELEPISFAESYSMIMKGWGGLLVLYGESEIQFDDPAEWPKKARESDRKLNRPVSP